MIDQESRHYMAQIVVSLTFVVFVCQGVGAAEWDNSSPLDGEAMYKCAGDSLTLAWEYVLHPNDTVGEAEWFYNGRSQEMIAMSSHNIFFTTPAFSHRVESVGNAGIVLRKLSVGDSGNYTVEIHMYANSGASHVLLRRTVFLQVREHLLTTDGALHAIQSSEAILDPNTKQWSIELQCGTFTITGTPHFQVEWTTPSGVSVNSSDFRAGQFTLLLPNPVQSGNYTCRIPPRSANDVCLQDNQDHEEQATVWVDKIEARLLLLEKEHQKLKQQLNSTQTELSVTKTDLSDTKNNLSIKLSNLKNNLSMELSNTKDDLHSRYTILMGNMTDYQHRLQTLENAPRQVVAFSARGLRSVYGHLVFSEVHYNQGGGYNSRTGVFTSPVSGIYMFIATTGSATSGSTVQFNLVVDDKTSISAASNVLYSGYFSQSSVHGVVHLNVGQSVAINPYGSTFSDFSSFSGFLIAADR